MAVALLAALAACGEKTEQKAPPPAPVVVEKVSQQDVPMQIELVGETAGYRDVEVRSRVNGILLKRTYTEGQFVQAGQVLFEIDPEPYKAALDQAKGVLAQSMAALEKAKADRDRIIPLYKENAVSRKDFDDAMAAYDSALANSQSAQAKVKEAELNLGYTRVTAPISGVTSKVAQSEGSLIMASSGSPLTTISQFEPLYVNFSYSEQDRLNFERNVASGKMTVRDSANWTAHIRLADGSMYDKVGRVNFSDNRVDPKTGTIQARAIFDNKDGKLLPGQFVRLILDIGTRKDAIVVPERAVTQSQADKLVMVVSAGGDVEPRTVKLGPSVKGGVLVEEGVKPGEQIIVEGLMKARPGAKVQPMTASQMQAALAAKAASAPAAK
ncbi:efflux RND transporter periplasmic adaptor subunit [Chitinilyticum aquatile]|uniref:efflux RND transporter periplasmic adaptor subunit n=1 Tax=Chitinilyticum aquatile TaxID=362520 RepID=UPI000425488B|nr:efflux RND transporter periplasmic adaptor subunit [Chitinilyticum aquatile]